jgi:hypothetical protein
MKTSSLIVALSVALSVMAAPQGNNRQGSNVAQNNNRFGNGGNNQNQNGGNNGNTAASNGQTAGKNGVCIVDLLNSMNIDCLAERRKYR